LQNGMRAAIRSERLRVGERLPSSRQLARDLGVSRGLVQSTYEQLTAEGYLVASAGSATRVAATHQAPDRRSPGRGRTQKPEIDFAPGRPDLRSFPVRDWLWACGEAVRTASSADFGYGDGAGSLLLRQVVASYAQRVRAAAVDSD
jgi:GntR family transcriptional regulator / MocR family aminotransferase